VHLDSLHRCEYICAGKVLRCRYLKGSGSLYEVAVLFDKPIDIALFARGAVEIKILLVDEDAAMHRIVQRLLSSLNATIVAVPSPQDAIAHIKSTHFDMVLMNATAASDAPGVLREQGLARPIIAMTTNNDDATREQCLSAGFNAFVTKPFTRETIEELVLSVKQEPVVSSLVHDPGMTELIDQFVEQLAEDVQAMEVAFIAQDWDKLAQRAQALKGRAGMHGFEGVWAAAVELEEALTAKLDRHQLRARVNDLSRICFSARPASVSQVD
jgi:CheY-like chemotaxis protein